MFRNAVVILWVTSAWRFRAISQPSPEGIHQPSLLISFLFSICPLGSISISSIWEISPWSFQKGCIMLLSFSKGRTGWSSGKGSQEALSLVLMWRPSQVADCQAREGMAWPQAGSSLLWIHQPRGIHSSWYQASLRLFAQIFSLQLSVFGVSTAIPMKPPHASFFQRPL